MKVKLKILKKDSRNVAKAVLYDEQKRVLLLKRSDYHKKHAGEWDLPGGHTHVGEDLEEGLSREVEEETNLKIKKPIFCKKDDNLHFFYAKLPSNNIKLSSEHTEFKFFDKKDLNTEEKFQKIAFDVLEKLENE
jgi:8-oxo-dGTP pyrophosphatase MutT (NUDIX family)